MPASRDNRRMVTYVPVVIATEIERRARADGRTVSGWLSRLIAEALSDLDQDVEVDHPVSPDPHTRLDGSPTPAVDADEVRAQADPEYADWLRRKGLR